MGKKLFLILIFIIIAVPSIYAQSVKSNNIHKYSQAVTDRRDWYKRRFNINNAQANSLVLIDSIYRKKMVEMLSNSSLSPSNNRSSLLIQINSIQSERDGAAQSVLTNTQFQKWKQIHSEKHPVYPKHQFMSGYAKQNPDTLKQELKKRYHISDDQADAMIAIDHKFISEMRTIFADSSVKGADKRNRVNLVLHQRRTGMAAILSSSQFSQWVHEQEKGYRDNIKKISVKK